MNIPIRSNSEAEKAGSVVVNKAVNLNNISTEKTTIPLTKLISGTSNTRPRKIEISTSKTSTTMSGKFFSPTSDTGLEEIKSKYSEGMYYVSAC